MSFIGAVFLGSTILLAAASLAAWCLRTASASTRHALWAITMGGLLLLPLAEGLLPKLELPVLAPVEAGPVAEVGRAASLAGVSEAGIEPSVVPAIRFPVMSGEVEALEAVSAAAPPVSSPWNWREWLAAVWALGALIIALRLLIGTWSVRRLWNRAVRPGEPEWRAVLGELCLTMGVRSPIRLRISSEPIPPMTLGVFGRAILLPRDAVSWSHDRRRVVLAHELAHVRRRDGLTQVLAQVVQTLYWFHPLAWYGVHRLAEERERAADDQVLALDTQRGDYAEHLVAVTRAIGAGVSLATLTMAEPSRLETRLLAILDPGTTRQAASRFVVVFLAVGVVALTLPAATLRLTATVRAPAALAGSGSAVEMPPPEARPAEEFGQVQGGIPAPARIPVGQDGELATVGGVVTDLTRAAPMAGISVTFAGDDGVQQIALTDQEGRFHTNLAPGRYVLGTEAPGYYRPARSAGPVTLSVSGGQEVDDVLIQLAPTLAISGRVTGEDGSPVGGMDVIAVRREYDDWGRSVIDPCLPLGTVPVDLDGQRQVTDERGGYRLFGLEPGEYYVAVAQRGCGYDPPPQYYPGGFDVAQAVPVVLAGRNDMPQINIRMADVQGYPVRFTVSAPDADFMGNAWRFILVRQSGVVESRTVALGMYNPVTEQFTGLPDGFTKSDGVWTSPALPPGAYILYLSTDLFRHRTGVAAFNIVDREVDAGTVLIREPHLVSGSVEGGGLAEPDLASLRVVLKAVDWPVARFSPGSVEGDGSFAFIEASSRLRSILFPGSPLKGTVEPGRYEVELAGLPPDLYLAAAEYGGREILGSGLLIDAAPAGPLQLTLDGPGGIVDGVVRDALDEPVTDARVVLVPSQTGLQGNSTFYRTASSDQYGRFVIQGVRPGDYQVMAWTRVQENAWMNPGFRQPFQTLAESVAVEKGDRETLDLRVIPGN